MSWTKKDKKTRFDASQTKKSIAAGLKRNIENHEMVYTHMFVGTYGQYIESIAQHVSFTSSFSTALNEARKEAVEKIHSGYLKLENGEEIRIYVPKKFI